MAADLIYAFRVMRLPRLDAGGAPIGRIEDIVAIPGRAGKGREPAIPPRVVGFVANSQRRRIFVNANRVAELNSDGARLRSWDVDLNPFKPRPGEVLIGGDLIDRRTARVEQRQAHHPEGVDQVGGHGRRLPIDPAPRRDC